MSVLHNIDAIKGSQKALTLVVTNGFEERAAVGIARLQKQRLRFKRIVLVRYSGPEHGISYKKVVATAQKLVAADNLHEVPPSAMVIEGVLDDLRPESDEVICDISGLSRALMLSLLTRLCRRGFPINLLYTEAKEYFPRRKEFERFLEEPEPGDAFAKLAEYEEGDVIYSSTCRIEDIPELLGANFPNHPLMLVSFLTFKRSRLSAVLNQYETNARMLIEGEPVRRDLQWRKRALEIINFDLLSENKGNVIRLPTLYWDHTYQCLQRLYRSNSLGYRFNFILAPLGGKMQTVGAWYFAVSNPDVKVVTSTPTRLYPDKYSIGFTDTHVIHLPRPQISGAA